MASLEINPPRAALVDERGEITSEWYRFFVEVVRRIGGTTNPLDDGQLQAEGRFQPFPDIDDLKIPDPVAEQALAEVGALYGLILASIPANQTDDLLYPPSYQG